MQEIVCLFSCILNMDNMSKAIEKYTMHFLKKIVKFQTSVCQQ